MPSEDEEFSRSLEDVDFTRLFSDLEKLTSLMVSQIPKFFNSFLNALPEGVDSNFKSLFTKNVQERFYASGSLIEGCAFSRLLNPSLPSNHVEIECDFLEIFGKIDKDKVDELVNDLPYAKGFVWIKYDSEITELNNCCLEFGEQRYMHASAFRKHIADRTKKTSATTGPSLYDAHQYEAGPSAALDMTVKIKSILTQIPKQTEMKEGLAVLHGILQYLAESFPKLVKMYEDLKNAEGELYQFLVNKLSSKEMLSGADIYALFHDSNVKIVHEISNQNNKIELDCKGNPLTDGSSLACKNENPSRSATEMVIESEADNNPNCASTSSIKQDLESTNLSLAKSIVTTDNESTSNSTGTITINRNEETGVLPTAESTTEAVSQDSSVGANAAVPLEHQRATRPKDHKQFVEVDRKETQNQEVREKLHETTAKHPGNSWNKSINRIAVAMHAVLTEVEGCIKRSNAGKLLGYSQLHVLPLLEKVTKLADEFVLINLSLGCLEKKLSQLWSGTPEAFIPYMLTTCVLPPGEATDLYSVVLGALQQCFRILPPRLAVLDAICYSYDEMYENLVNNGEPKENAFHLKDVLDGIITSMDRVPAFEVKQWPALARSWVTRDRIWPKPEVINTIVEEGCHIVPKPYKGQDGNEDLDWRWSFSKPEIIIAKARTQKMTMCYFLLKCIFYKYFKALNVKDTTLSSYFVKTVMLFESEAHEESWWEENSMLFCLEHLVDRLNSSMAREYLSHYFISDLNLLEGLPVELIREANAVAESILCDIRTPVTEVLLSMKECSLLFEKGIKDKGSDDASMSPPKGEVSKSDVSSLHTNNKEDNVRKESKNVEALSDRRGDDMDRTGLEQNASCTANAREQAPNDFYDLENMPVVIAKMKKCFLLKQEKFKDIKEKQGLLVIVEKAISHIEQLYPGASQIAESLSVELSPDDNFTFQLPIIWHEEPLQQMPSISISFSCSKTIAFNFNMY